jgi:N-acetylmuramate 1-kinase
MSLQISHRSDQLKQFIDECFVQNSYKSEPVTGDAGLREYTRIRINDASSYIVMDCPPEYTSVQPFIYMSEFLNKNKFSAPQVIKSDINNGFLILQDFGNLSVKNYLLKSTKGKKEEIYHSCIDLLIQLQNTPLPQDLKLFDNELMLSELSVFTNYYIPYKINKTLKENEISEFQGIFRTILASQSPTEKSIVLRDYHVENIMYLDKEKGIKKLGLLDFQDALIGSPVYDLVSILEDARIDVDRHFALECISYYAQKKNMEVEQANINYHILGAQRNLRILGVFTRKYLQEKNDNYLQYIPRVLKYLEYDLSHPILMPLKKWLSKAGVM